MPLAPLTTKKVVQTIHPPNFKSNNVANKRPAISENTTTTVTKKPTPAEFVPLPGLVPLPKKGNTKKKGYGKAKNMNQKKEPQIYSSTKKNPTSRGNLFYKLF